ELERICLKAISKRVTDRYTTGRDMADDLRHFLGLQSEKSENETPAVHEVKTSEPEIAVTRGPQEDSSRWPLKIVPKGLRSFDAHDSDFFLKLLPGPRDRDGLPESIRFWKNRIESSDADHTFSVGLMYGPSGCGKSSLMKAGLLPRLSPLITVVYIEASTVETESRILRGLRARITGLPPNLSLIESVVALRRGLFLAPEQQVLIVLDQFEQWLHVRREQQGTELVSALRQCDGKRLQCILMVRDDFWMATTRFMHELEIRLLEGQNSDAVDLFDLEHAQKVLAAFGLAFGRLPENAAEISHDQTRFLEQSVAGLAHEGKVICVRLALFAEMVKNKPWTPATLKTVGGTEGVGVAFLEETFSAPAAPPERRYHQKAAKAVLKALLPDAGTDIKGQMRPRSELLKAANYTHRPQDFDDLLHMLDSEIRLITPVDLEESSDAEESASNRQAGQTCYQLTHDYLTPSLRNWLSRKQRETMRGRAELRLASLSSQWNALPTNRQLPQLWEFFSILFLTARNSWTEPQRKMLRQAGKVHGLRSCVAAAVLAFVLFGIWETRGRFEAASHVDQVARAKITEVPGLVKELASFRRWANPILEQKLATAEDGSSRQLNLRLAILPVNDGQVDEIFDRFLVAAPDEIFVLQDALAPHQQQLLEKLWAILEHPVKGHEQRRLRAASALASYDAESPKWEQLQNQIADDLVNVPELHLPTWMNAMRPVSHQLLPRFNVIFRDSKRTEAERSLAIDFLFAYADGPELRAELLMDADVHQFSRLFPNLLTADENALAPLLAEVEKPLSAETENAAKERLAKRQANAATALLRLNRPEKVWPLLKHSADPRARSYLIHRFVPSDVKPQIIVDRLGQEQDVSAQRALILALGEYDETDLPPIPRTKIIKQLQDWYLTRDDAGVHAAAEWLLRQWHQETWLRRTNDAWRENKAWSDNRLEAIRQELQHSTSLPNPRWYVNSQGQTLVVIPGPVHFQAGSPLTETGRLNSEYPHLQRIDRSYVISAKHVTEREYKASGKMGYAERDRYAPEEDCPIIGQTWAQAAEYCNWLSQQDAIPETQWCYQTNDKGELTVRKHYARLTGYRLATEAEREYACRANSVTSRYYGESEELLGKYAYYVNNAQERCWPVGGKKPNDFGLFDMNGNVWSWCQEKYYPQPLSDSEAEVRDQEDELAVRISDRRTQGGGSFINTATLIRSAVRGADLPGGNRNVGFRVVRTLP
ncbi:MAG: stkP 5, partial [Planctomycetaceae bacterium]|nr:stkP 5 [Planctomycetaceae bacterium]